MSNENLSEEFSQELADLKNQFENMQQVFGKLQGTVAEAEQGSQGNQGNMGSQEDQKMQESQNKQQDQKSNNNMENKQSQQQQQGSGKQENKEGQQGFSVESGKQLLNQIEEFKKQAQEKQKESENNIKGSLDQAISLLQKASKEIRNNQSLNDINVYISSAEQQINSLNNISD